MREQLKTALNTENSVNKEGFSGKKIKLTDRLCRLGGAVMFMPLLNRAEDRGKGLNQDNQERLSMINHDQTTMTQDDRKGSLMIKKSWLKDSALPS